MEDILKLVLSNKIYIIACAFIIASILYIIFKKLIAILAISIIAFLIYSYVTNNKPDKAFNNLKQPAQEEGAVEMLQTIKQEIKEEISKLIN